MTANAAFDVFNCKLDGVSLIEASAGTGKTWNICGLYLRLLLECGLEVQEILVVTFTNAATAELRERIRSRIVETRDYLDGTSLPENDPFVADLISALDKLPDIDIDRLKKRLELALQTFDEASIFTIHSFCQRALADTAFAAGQAFALELVPDDTDLRLEAVHDFWRRHIAGERLGAGLAAYLLQRKDNPEKFSKLLKRQLGKPLAHTMWPDSNASAIDDSMLVSTYAAARACWLMHREMVVDVLTDSSDTLKQNSYKENQIRAAAANYDAFFSANEPLTNDIGIEQLKLFRASNLEVGKGTKNGKIPPQHEFFELAETMLTERENIEAALLLARLSLIRRMLEESEVAIRKRKHEQGLVSYNDILYNVYDALNSGEKPWLAESLRQRFPAALVDEFQDTDPLQFCVFDTIYGDGNSPLFLVGDPKQAIYRFRNADLNTYLDAKKNTTAIYSISDNQRSTEPLIDALNSLFSANQRTFMLPGLDYQRVGFGSRKRKKFTDHSSQNADLQVWMLPQENDGPIQRKQAIKAVANATAAEIARLLQAASKQTVCIDDQALQAGDIAVLVRTHKQGNDIRQALAALNISSVELSQSSIFSSSDAEEVERVLTAIWSPARTSLLRAALATELIGCDAKDIEKISASESELMYYIQRFAAYRDTWLQRGVGFMYRQLLAAEKVSARMLRRPDGERRMTNLLHFGELLHQAAESHPSPDALLRWLQTQKHESSTDEAAQLRLESDQNIVKILTIHKSKGLEYPVVFCPFLWTGSVGASSRMEGREYHDSDGKSIIDFRPESKDDLSIKAEVALENSAEDLRLIYVALTRAVYRCYLVAGIYAVKKSIGLSSRSLLNWLVAGNGYSPSEWIDSKKAKQSQDEIEQAWQGLADSNKRNIQVATLPQHKGMPLNITQDASTALISQPTPRYISSGWRIGSYSGLSRGATHENAASEHDVQIPVTPPPESTTTTASHKDDILDFPRGANAGDCIHKAFELCDFSDPSSWKIAIELALSTHPQEDDSKNKPLAAMMLRMMQDVVNTAMPDDIMLRDVGFGKRLTELGFHLPSANLSASAFNRTLTQLGYDVPHLHFSDFSCYLKGFIDLVFEHEGRYYILDWKSNYLGNSPANYEVRQMADAMNHNGYHLQYLLYTLALNRYLERRIPGYHYDRHFGGVLYLFVRGVRPDWKNADGTASGVYFKRPSHDAIEQLDALFTALPTKAA